MAFKTSNQKKDEAERLSNQIFQKTMDDHKASPDKFDPEKPIRDKLKMDHENAEFDRKHIKEREEEVEKLQEESKKMPGVPK